jgi:hypothetical protein
LSHPLKGKFEGTAGRGLFNAIWNVIQSRAKEMKVSRETRRKGSKELQAVEIPGAEETGVGAVGSSTDDEEIRRRAYEIYLERGENSGNELEDWLQAERELQRG